MGRRPGAEPRTQDEEESDGRRLPILAEDLAQDPALLPERGVGVRASEEVGHEVRIGRAWATGSVAQADQGGFDCSRIALAPDTFEAIQMRPQRLLRDFEERDRDLLGRVRVAVDADDDAI